MAALQCWPIFSSSVSKNTPQVSKADMHPQFTGQAISWSDRQTHTHTEIWAKEISGHQTHTQPSPFSEPQGLFRLFPPLSGPQGRRETHEMIPDTTDHRAEPAWAVWYQHFSAWLWTSKAGGFAMISPGWSLELYLLGWLELLMLAQSES